MLYVGIIQSLQTGAATASELAARLGTVGPHITRDCARLISAGIVQRVDGRTGRGARATYGLCEVDPEILETALSGGPIPKKVEQRKAGPPINPALLVQRDRCPYCNLPPHHSACSHGWDGVATAMQRRNLSCSIFYSGGKR